MGAARTRSLLAVLVATAVAAGGAAVVLQDDPAQLPVAVAPSPTGPPVREALLEELAAAAPVPSA
ncbi:MAG: hypothetical protein LH469_04970, partial [Frankiaceae bacterium]|nr:hypothetical protein [Frankiaceae bacterium]